MEELISVIIPVYNVEKYLEQSINSVLNQTYKNLEILLVNDGSTDNSGKICNELSIKDERIKVIHKENGGLSSARNAGLDIAKGKYITFLDSDDCIIPDAYEYLYNIIKNEDVDIAEGEFLRVPLNKYEEILKIIEYENRKKNVREKIITNKEALEIYYGTKETPYVQQVVVWNKLYKKEILDNIRFQEGRLHEDEFITYKLLFKSKRICVSNKIIHAYIQTPNSIMRKEISKKRINDNLDAYEESSMFFKENLLKEMEMKARRKYLEYCIELSGKIKEENSSDKLEKLLYIQKKFNKFYFNYINEIIKYNNNPEEKQHIEIINKAYNDKELYKYWDELKILIK